MLVRWVSGAFALGEPWQWQPDRLTWKSRAPARPKSRERRRKRQVNLLDPARYFGLIGGLSWHLLDCTNPFRVGQAASKAKE